MYILVRQNYRNHYRVRPSMASTEHRMEVREAIQKRRAGRKFDTRPIEEDKIMLLIEAMRLAPSCNNNQPWRVVVAKDKESLEKIKVALTKGNA